jgi:predicted MFS family arabinose efflux permease
VPERRAAGQLGILAGAFLGGAAIAGALGADSLGVALGVGQLCFAAALAWVLLR